MKYNIDFATNVTDNTIIIEGNKLNFSWFNNCILIWSDKDNKNPLPKKILEILKEIAGEKESKWKQKQQNQDI